MCTCIPVVRVAGGSKNNVHVSVSLFSRVEIPYYATGLLFHLSYSETESTFSIFVLPIPGFMFIWVNRFSFIWPAFYKGNNPYSLKSWKNILMRRYFRIESEKQQ